MRIEQLEYLTAVTQHGSLRRASERLHLSQPALSEAISRLERELGVTLLDRRRSGARISRQGRDLLHPMVEVLEAVDRLRRAAGDQGVGARVVRLGTVDAATSRLVTPALRAFAAERPGTTTELVGAPHADVHQGLVEGGLDLALVDVLDGDDAPTDVLRTDLLHGRAVAVVPRDHPLAPEDAVEAEQLRREPFVAMRPGYVMHRFVHRLLGGVPDAAHWSADGAEAGKLMVADGLGVTVLPDYSVAGDPLERAGLLVARPLVGGAAPLGVTLALHQRIGALPAAVRDLRAHLLAVAAGGGNQEGPGRVPAA